jgi:ribosomal protein S18 acetylase RimI-like enzyme
MDEYRFARALAYDFGALADMFTSAFTGYFFPMSMTAEAMAAHWRLNHIDGARSLVMLDAEGAFVGISLIGARGTRGWCGGFGVAPAYRGRGAGKRLAREMVETARASGLSSLQLEVLTQNDAARAIYEAAGLRVRRRLQTVEIALAALPGGADISHRAAASIVVAGALPDVDAALAIQPIWQQELASLLAITTETTQITDGAGVRNTLICARSGDKTRILVAAVAPTLTERELTGLLRSAAGESAAIQLVNCPASDATLARCLALGFNEVYSQDEMFLAL